MHYGSCPWETSYTHTAHAWINVCAYTRDNHLHLPMSIIMNWPIYSKFHKCSRFMREELWRTSWQRKELKPGWSSDVSPESPRVLGSYLLRPSPFAIFIIRRFIVHNACFLHTMYECGSLLLCMPIQNSMHVCGSPPPPATYLSRLLIWLLYFFHRQWITFSVVFNPF